MPCEAPRDWSAETRWGLSRRGTAGDGRQAAAVRRDRPPAARLPREAVWKARDSSASAAGRRGAAPIPERRSAGRPRRLPAWPVRRVRSPHQRAAVPIQISAASRHIVRPKLAAAVVAWTGSAVDRSESVTRARVISPHEIGSSRWRGLARHSWSAISGSSSELAP